MPDQCVVAMGVDDVEAAEILGGVAPCKLPGPQPGAQGVWRGRGEHFAHMIAGIRRAFIGCEDGHAVAALCQGIGQPVGRVGHAAGLGAGGRGQMGGQYGDFHSGSSIFRLRRPAQYPDQRPRSEGMVRSGCF